MSHIRPRPEYIAIHHSFAPGSLGDEARALRASHMMLEAYQEMDRLSKIINESIDVAERREAYKLWKIAFEKQELAYKELEEAQNSEEKFGVIGAL